jgi:ABC-2 type transport system ATP-binding protein
MAQLAIEVSNLSKQFNSKTVLDNICINVPQCSVYGFLGNNGAGKSTLIRILLGLLSANSGVVKINSQKVSKNDVAYKCSIGCLVESPCLYLQLTPREYLSIACKIKGLPKTSIDKALELVNMCDHSNIPMDIFSLGMKQRIAIANSLLGMPKLLILDEPTNGLDPAGMQEVRCLLKSLPEKTGTTVFLSSHLLDEIQKTASHVGILHQGKIKIESNLSELMSQQSSSLDLITPSATKLMQYFAQNDIPSQLISSNNLRIHNVRQSQCSDYNRQVIHAGFELVESRFNQATLESLFLQLVGPQTLNINH